MERIKKKIQLEKIVEVKVITRSSTNQIILDNDVIKIKITEIPENGKANKAIINLFSKQFKIPKKNIEIIKGITSSHKTLKFNI